jgi:hypothetical protein
MSLEALEILLLTVELVSYCDSCKMSYFFHVLIAIPDGSTSPQGIDTIVVSGSFLPFLDCRHYSGFPPPIGFTAEVLREIRALFGNLARSRDILSDCLNDFHPDNLHAQEVLEVLKYQIALGLQCWKLFTVMPTTLRTFLNHSP